MNRRTVAGIALLVGVVTGVSLWVSMPRSTPDTKISPSLEASPTVALGAPAESAPDAASALDHLSNQLGAARQRRAERPGELADLLMRAAELSRELGRDNDARAYFQEVKDVRGGGTHWQAREAVRSLVDLEADAARPEADQAKLRQARELHRTATALCRRGRYLAAVPVCERALAIRRALHAEPHPDVAESIRLLGELQSNRGELYGKAFDTLLEAREGFRRTLGEDHPAYAGCLHWMGVLEDERGAFVEAQDLYHAALDVLRPARGEFSAEYATTLARLGRMHAAWCVTGAEAKIVRAMQIRETVLGSKHPDFAESLHDLGVLAFHWLHLERAKDLFQKARQVREAALGAEHPLSAESLSWLGRALVDEVDLTVGHEYHRQAIALAETAHGRDHPLVARYVGNFAQMCHQECDFDRGDQLFVRAMDIRTKVGLARHPEHASLLRGRAMNLNEWAFGAVYWESREVNLQPVEKVYDELIRLYETMPGSEQLPEYAGALLEFAEVYYIDEYRRRSQSDCRKLIAKAKGMMELSGSIDTHPFYLTYLTASSYAATSEGNYAQSKQFLDLAVTYSHGRFGYAFPYKRIIGAMLRVGQRFHQGKAGGPLTEENLEDFKAVQEVDRGFTHLASGALSTPARLGIMRSHSETANALLSLVLRFQAPFDAYQQVLDLRGLAASAQAIDQFAYDQADLLPLLGRLRDCRRDLTRAVYSAPSQVAERPRWLAEVYRLGNLKDDLESEIAFKVRGGRQEQDAGPVTLARVQEAMPADAVFIEYVGFQLMESPPSGRGRLLRVPSLIAFVVRKSGPPTLVPLGPREAIERAVANWRAAVTGTKRTDATNLVAASNRLSELVWLPIAKHVGDAQRLIIAPDGPIASVTFAALPGKSPGRYLLEDYRIQYVPAGRVLAAHHSVNSKPGTGLLVMGDIAYSTDSRGAHPALKGLSKLPFTKLEIDNLAKRFEAASPGVSVARLTGGEATGGRFAAAVSARPRYIHFAGHGFFAEPRSFPDLSDGPAGRSGLFSRGRTGHPALLRNQQLLSGLVMAKGDHPADSLFTAEQVGSQDYRGTELVVLSACETGVGDVALSEGAMSLQRAFLAAGARSVVASHWKVDDAATAVLMDEFYRNLWEKQLPKADALREAQLTVLRRPQLVDQRARELRGLDTAAAKDLPEVVDSPGGRTNPAYWAAFTLTGDGR
jgi:CHAT domain-containing protein/tetratricopeptide (TPR) repeat protein